MIPKPDKPLSDYTADDHYQHAMHLLDGIRVGRERVAEAAESNPMGAARYQDQLRDMVLMGYAEAQVHAILATTPAS